MLPFFDVLCIFCAGMCGLYIWYRHWVSENESDIVQLLPSLSFQKTLFLKKDENELRTYGLPNALSVGGTYGFQLVLNATLSVDIFFCMSGMLICYWSVKRKKEIGNKFTLRNYACHRLLRIYPLYVPVLMFTFLDLNDSGPVLKESLDYNIRTCSTTWWKNILLINNFGYPKTECLPYTWYMAADFQLYLSAFPIVLIISRWPIAGITACLTGIVGSMLYSGIVTYINGHLPTLMSTLRIGWVKTKYFASQVYFLPFPHAGPFFVGMLAGYLLATKPNLKLSSKVQAFGWSISFAMCSYCLFGTINWNRGEKPTVLDSVFYASFSRVIWATGVAWLIICCVTGHGGLINDFLSWKVFVPLSRLSYGIYMVHVLVIDYIISSISKTIYFQQRFIIWMYLGHLSVSIVVSFMISRLFEYPISSLGKIFIEEGKVSNLKVEKES